MAVRADPGTSYNRPLPLNAAQKAIIAVAGFVWGVARMGISTDNPASPARPNPVPGTPDEQTAARLNKLEEVVLGVSHSSQPARPQVNERFVTERRMAEALNQVECRVRLEVSEQMRSHGLAIDSLREMIEGTDALLERVLERLEASLNNEDARDGGSPERTPPDLIAPRARKSMSDLRANAKP
jgi:hypothetical protein